MKIVIKIVLYLQVVLLILSGCSADYADSSSQNSIQTPASTPSHKTESSIINSISSETVINTALTQKELNLILDILNSVDLPEILVASSGFVYSMAKEECDTLVSVNIKGVPVLLEESYRIEKTDMQLKEDQDIILLVQDEVFCEVAFAILRIDRLYTIHHQKTFSSSEKALRGCEKQFIAEFYKYAKKESARILASDTDIENKIEALMPFGIIVVPEVVKAIEKGEADLGDFFTVIGLHMNTVEYQNHMIPEQRPEWMPLSYEERISNSSFMDGAESFDYKVWLSENEKDLENLFKYLDAYCAEYEAQKN